ncbi:hypothetical protein OS493_010559 [Desmophyllum pertusum]|uniref:Uncharacterized protein n=1 Tax=Desmophyllum pertusum TaxID=174260 RepID=A0A9W9ZQW7_9CNID|nr:hypothetical protein OS493_010559 [Desmophyllum pertusum]
MAGWFIIDSLQFLSSKPLNDMPLRWDPSDSSSDDDLQDDALRTLHNFQEKNNLSYVGILSFEESPEKEQELDMKQLRKNRAVRKTAAMRMDSIQKTLETGCCKVDKCLSQFSAEEIRDWRSGFWSVSETERRQSLLHGFNCHVYHDGKKENTHLK